MANDPWEQLRERLNKLYLYERDIDEQFVRSTGHGGQNVNKVSSCVLLMHRPTGIRIRCEEDRSQARNRFLARVRLADRRQALNDERDRSERFAIEKKRRQKRKRSKKAKEQLLRNKHHRSDVKKNRRRIHESDL